MRLTPIRLEQQDAQDERVRHCALHSPINPLDGRKGIDHGVAGGLEVARRRERQRNRRRRGKLFVRLPGVVARAAGQHRDRAYDGECLSHAPSRAMCDYGAPEPRTQTEISRLPLMFCAGARAVMSTSPSRLPATTPVTLTVAVSASDDDHSIAAGMGSP